MQEFVIIRWRLLHSRRFVRGNNKPREPVVLPYVVCTDCCLWCTWWQQTVVLDSTRCTQARCHIITHQCNIVTQNYPTMFPHSDSTILVHLVIDICPVRQPPTHPVKHLFKISTHYQKSCSVQLNISLFPPVPMDTAVFSLFYNLNPKYVSKHGSFCLLPVGLFTFPRHLIPYFLTANKRSSVAIHMYN